MPTYICLVRGINVGGRNMIPMAELRTVCTDLGWMDVRTYIQSGNLFLRSTAAPEKLESDLEHAIARHFGLDVSVLVRLATDWPAYVAGNPFPEESEREPHLVMLALSKAPPRSKAVQSLLERANKGEQIVQVDEALWVYFPGGAGTTRLSSAIFDKLVGSPVTMRNWRTVVKIGEFVLP